MSRPTRRHFWSDWPEASQKRFFKLVLLGSITLTLSVFIGLKLVGNSLELEIAQAKEQYGRVIPLVRDVVALRAQMGDLAHLPVEEAVWFIIDDLSIEPDLTSIRSTTTTGDVKATQVTFSGLSQAKLTSFLEALRKRASLQTPECVLTRNPDNPRLADLHVVLGR